MPRVSDQDGRSQRSGTRPRGAFRGEIRRGASGQASGAHQGCRSSCPGPDCFRNYEMMLLGNIVMVQETYSLRRIMQDLPAFFLGKQVARFGCVVMAMPLPPPPSVGPGRVPRAGGGVVCAFVLDAAAVRGFC